jgi:hypothetical protein
MVAEMTVPAEANAECAKHGHNDQVARRRQWVADQYREETRGGRQVAQRNEGQRRKVAQAQFDDRHRQAPDYDKADQRDNRAAR